MVENTLDSDFDTARQLHWAGRSADAARLYHALLERKPDHADALHLFGVLHYQNGYFARAVEMIGRAVTLDRDNAAYHANLAEAHRALGQYDQAIDCCRTALRLRPDYPEAANNLGLVLHALSQFTEAVAQFRAALEMRPDFALAQNNLGTSLRELGRFGEALQAYHLAVALDPKLAMARSNLGQLLVDQGEAEEGLANCAEAVALEPDRPAAHNNLGNAYRALERFSEARAAYDEALRLASLAQTGPSETAQVHANRGLALFLEGDRAGAFACFRQAVEIAPDDAQIGQYLANAHEAAEDYASALACWQRIVELNPTLAMAHNHLGWALQQEGRFAEAAACFRRALELGPYYVGAHLNQGGLHEELGEMVEAEACYRRAQNLHPRASAPLARLAVLLRGKLPASDLDAIQSQLGLASESDCQTNLPSLPPRSPSRSPLLFGLAHVLDARGEYAVAAQCLEEANATARDQRRKDGKNYDRAIHSKLVDRIIAGFTPRLFDRLAGSGDQTRLPVFVFGMPRSGTTLVEQVLASHSRVHGAGELALAARLFESIPELLGQPDEMLPCLEALDAAAVRELSRRHRDGVDATLQAVAPGVERVVDKMPDNYLYLGLLALLFPRATFIHVRRDLRDVAVSCWMTSFRSIRWADDRENLARRCRDYRRLMEHWQAVLPVSVHEVTYENLVNDFDVEGPRLLAACGLEWEPACGRFHETARPVRTASVTQVRQPLYRRALARWKNYETTLGELFALLPAL
jgi:tetratricopeptide (TPR) repeat protein